MGYFMLRNDTTLAHDEHLDKTLMIVNDRDDSLNDNNRTTHK